MIELRRLGERQHEPYAGAVEERQLRHLEQRPEAEDVAIERNGPVEILDVDGDLSDGTEAEAA